MPAKATARRPSQSIPVGSGSSTAVEHRQCDRPAGAEPVALGRRAHRDEDVGPRQAGLDRLAQRPGRDHPTVAEAEAGVDDDDREILRKRRVLESVVHHHRRRTGRLGGPAGRGAVAPDPDGRECREEQRLVADLGGAVPALVDPHRPRQAPAVAARDDMHRHAARPQPLDDRDRRRGLAGAAGGQVADADHRHAEACRRTLQPPPGRPGPGPGQRRQQPREEPRPLRRVGPEGGRLHQRGRSSSAPIASSTASVTSAPSLQAAQAAAAISAARSGAIVATSASQSSVSERTSTAAWAAARRR